MSAAHALAVSGFLTFIGFTIGHLFGSRSGFRDGVISERNRIRRRTVTNERPR
jgi:hypothetical protein